MGRPATLNLEVYQGDDEDWVLRVRSVNDGVLGDYINLTTATITAQVRDSAAAATALATFTITKADQNTLPGQFTITLPRAVTAALPPTTSTNTHSWDLQVEVAGKLKTYLAGEITVIAQVTR